MSFIIVIIGKPASGKSTFVSLLDSKFRTTKYQTQIFNDRDILWEMAQDARFGDLIKASDESNFEVYDNRVYDIAIEHLVLKLTQTKDDKIKLVEFSRREYVKAFAGFKHFLASNECQIVYLETNFDLCKERNLLREYHVPPKEMDSYFKVDDIDQLISAYPEEILTVNNDLQEADLNQRIEEIWPALTTKLREYVFRR